MKHIREFRLPDTGDDEPSPCRCQFWAMTDRGMTCMDCGTTLAVAKAVERARKTVAAFAAAPDPLANYAHARRCAGL